jgi:hypothetical protein
MYSIMDLLAISKVFIAYIFEPTDTLNIFFWEVKAPDIDALN